MYQSPTCFKSFHLLQWSEGEIFWSWDCLLFFAAEWPPSRVFARPSKSKHVIHFAKVRWIMRSWVRWDHNILSAWHSYTFQLKAVILLPMFPSVSSILSFSTAIKTSLHPTARRSLVLHWWEPVSWQRAHRLRTNTSKEAWVSLGLWWLSESTTREERKNVPVDL